MVVSHLSFNCMVLKDFKAVTAKMWHLTDSNDQAKSLLKALSPLTGILVGDLVKLDIVSNYGNIRHEFGGNKHFCNEN